MTLKDFIGIPYKSRGADFDGADCYGLAVLYNKHMLGKDLPDYSSLYVSADDLSDASGAISKGRENWDAVTEGQAGDVILFRQMGVVSHVGVYLDGIDFLHIRHGNSAGLEAMDSANWAQRIEGLMRWN
jgi:cell wall-associated NlpC family hydrolase